jgi:hypothetical protein
MSVRHEVSQHITSGTQPHDLGPLGSEVGGEGGDGGEHGVSDRLVKRATKVVKVVNLTVWQGGDRLGVRDPGSLHDESNLGTLTAHDGLPVTGSVVVVCRSIATVNSPATRACASGVISPIQS